MAQAEVNYCWRCGKHVRKSGVGRCWYCNAVIERQIRPPRRCPYCQEIIEQEAIKCPHCGEFLDQKEREKRKAEEKPTHITFVIDKALIQGEQPLRLEGGREVPEEYRKRLSERTRRAIELNQPKLIDQPEVKALPEPGEPPETPRHGEQPAIEAKAWPVTKERDQAPTRRASGEVTPAGPRREGKAYGLMKKAGGALARRFEEALENEQAPAKREDDEAVTDAEFEDERAREERRYRVCEICGTEVLAADNYCFHCGIILRDEAAKPGRRRKVNMQSVLGLYVVVVLLMIAMGWTSTRAGQASENVLDEWSVATKALAGVSILMLGVIFFRRRTSGNQIAAIVFAVIWAAMMLWFWAAGAL